VFPLNLQYNLDYYDRLIILIALEADLKEVNNIFNDLAGLISDQGQMIDLIESNISNSAWDVASGVAELLTAASYTKSWLYAYQHNILTILVDPLKIFT
jgi:t-SNARE complex subunit (syntaxin)